MGVEVHNRALITAIEIKETPHPVCERYPVTGVQPLSIEVVLNLNSNNTPLFPISLEERRHLEVDAAGNLRYRRQTEYTTELGRRGERMREWRLIDGQLYSKEDNLAFERRPGVPGDFDLLVNQATDPFPALVSITSPNWTAVNSTESGWQIAVIEGDVRGEHISCGRSLDFDPWIVALEGELAVREASATVSLTTENGPYISRQGTWIIMSTEQETDTQLHISIEENVYQIVPEEPIVTPTQLADLGRTRTHQRLNSFLLQLSSEEEGEQPSTPGSDNQENGD